MELVMQAILEQRSHVLPYDRERSWPLDARMAMFVLEAGGQDPQFTRERQSEREPCRIIATVCGPDPRFLAHWVIYIRDMNDGHLGFICQSNLPIGERVMVHCATEDGQTVRIECQIQRSRPFMQGWIEGALQVCKSDAVVQRYAAA
jgi:hypothetical protein